MRRLTVCLAVVGLVTAFGASSAGAAGGDVEKFCKTAIKVDQVEEPGEKLLAKFSDTAPPEIVDTVDAAITQFQEEGEAAFEDEAFIALLAEIDQFVVDNCGFEVVDVTMQDYAFDGLPAELPTGTVALRLTNEGTELHEMHFHRLTGDSTLDDLLALGDDATEEDAEGLGPEIKGGGFAFPGASDVAFVTFKKPGTYVALCSIPVGSTPDAEEGGDGPPHFSQGMAAEFEVT